MQGVQNDDSMEASGTAQNTFYEFHHLRSDEQHRDSHHPSSRCYEETIGTK
jgi:hypothetical protein